MELATEDGHIVYIPSGCKKTLGRGSELALFDKTVSRHQVLVELKEQRKRIDSADHQSSLCGLFIEVLGANPVCILHSGQSTKGRSDSQDMVFLKKGEKETIFAGEKISFSLSQPKFFTAREEDGRKGNVSPKIMDRHRSLAEDDLLEKWKDRKSRKEAETSVSHATVLSDAVRNECLPEERDFSANEDAAGIAQAVARRQKRALERRQKQTHKLQDEQDTVAEDFSDVRQEALGPEVEEAGIAQAVAQRQKRALECGQQQMHKLQDEWGKEEDDLYELEDDSLKTQDMDPVIEFGFLVEGSEFDQYKNRRKQGRWIWPPSTAVAESSSDDDVQVMFTPKRDRKAKTEVDEEWGGDDQKEAAAVATAKKRKLGLKSNLRSHEPSTSKMRGRSLTKTKTSSGRIVKNQRGEIDEDEDEADDTLGGFIVNDDQEDPLDNVDAEDKEDLADDEDDADDEEEFSEEEEVDEIEEEEQNLQEPPKEITKKSEEKPICKYGKSCYRKNPDHLAQFRHQ